MNLDITGRHVNVTAALRDFTRDKLSKLERYLDGPIDAHVILAIEKHRHLAEIVIKSRNAHLSGKRETGDLYASIGEVADKLERQALKHKEKLHDHKNRTTARDPQVAAVLAGEPPAGADSDAPPETVSTTRIFRSRKYRAKPLTAEDAALQLEASGDTLLVYRDVDSDQVHVVFRQSDGNFGLVEPEN